jgi:transposase-like protein
MARSKKARNIIKNLPAVIAQPEPEAEPTDRFGRRSQFKREYIDIVRVLCEDGATDKEIAAELGVSQSVLYKWRNLFPELAAAMKLGKDIANDRMERTAYNVAVGYTKTVTVNIKVRNSDGSEKVVEVQQEVSVPPDPKMLQWMLKNRRPDSWKDRTEVGGEVEVVHLTADQAKERLKAKIEEIRLRALGNNSGGG